MNAMPAERGHAAGRSSGCLLETVEGVEMSKIICISQEASQGQLLRTAGWLVPI